MTRIISGRAGGRRLKVPDAGTRPTSDRVRESLFSSLQSAFDFDGARVLDLYAGSGALGLEALSRGAAEAVLVDSAPGAQRVLQANLAAVGLPGGSIERCTVQDFLRRDQKVFDLVLMDPPYRAGDAEVEQVLSALAAGWLAAGATVVVERGATGGQIRWPAGFGDPWERRFGGTHVTRAVWYGHEQVPDEPEPNP